MRISAPIAQMTTHSIRCAFCDWTTLAFWTGKDGLARSGMGKLRDHVGDQHPGEAERIYGDGSTYEYEQ